MCTRWFYMGSLPPNPTRYERVDDTRFHCGGGAALDADGNNHTTTQQTLLCRATDTSGEARLVSVLAIDDFYEVLQQVHKNSGHAKERPLWKTSR